MLDFIADCIESHGCTSGGKEAQTGNETQAAKSGVFEVASTTIRNIQLKGEIITHHSLGGKKLAEHKPVSEFGSFIDKLRDDVDGLLKGPGGSQVIKWREDLHLKGHISFPKRFEGAPTVVVSTSAYQWDTNHEEAYNIFDPQLCIGRVTGEGFDYECKGKLADQGPIGWTCSNLLYYLAAG